MLLLWARVGEGAASLLAVDIRMLILEISGLRGELDGLTVASLLRLEAAIKMSEILALLAITSWLGVNLLLTELRLLLLLLSHLVQLVEVV